MNRQRSDNISTGIVLFLFLIACFQMTGCRASTGEQNQATLADFANGTASTAGALTDNPAQTRRWGAIAGGGVGLAAGAAQIASGGWAVPLLSVPLAIAETWIGYTAGAIVETTAERALDAIAMEYNKESLAAFTNQPVSVDAIVALKKYGISDNGVYRFAREHPPTMPFTGTDIAAIDNIGLSGDFIAFTDRQLRMNGELVNRLDQSIEEHDTQVVEVPSRHEPMRKQDVLMMLLKERRKVHEVEALILLHRVSSRLSASEIIDWNRMGVPPRIINAMETAAIDETAHAPIIDARQL